MGLNLDNGIKMTLVDAHKWPMVLGALDKILRSEGEGIATPEAVQTILRRRLYNWESPSDCPQRARALIEVVTEEDYRRSVGEEVYALEEYSNPSQYKSASEFEAQTVCAPSCSKDIYGRVSSRKCPQSAVSPTESMGQVPHRRPTAPTHATSRCGDRGTWRVTRRSLLPQVSSRLAWGLTIDVWSQGRAGLDQRSVAKC